ncbi:MAG: hypothetical protein LBS85_06700, partial [Clostridiales Family XIII bacterium]|nr:hypothetical protein [Clostridiales Family XIII bacterium]
DHVEQIAALICLRGDIFDRKKDRGFHERIVSRSRRFGYIIYHGKSKAVSAQTCGKNIVIPANGNN